MSHDTIDWWMGLPVPTPDFQTGARVRSIRSGRTGTIDGRDPGGTYRVTMDDGAWWRWVQPERLEALS